MMGHRIILITIRGLGLMRFLHVLLALNLCAAIASADVQKEIQVDLDKVQSQLKKEIFVKYHHSRKILRVDPALKQVHLPYPARVNEPLLAWRTELAVKGSKTLDMMSTTLDRSVSASQDENSTTRLFDGSQGWILKGLSPDARMMKGEFLSGHKHVMLPEEDLYMEINGLEAARQGVGVSFRWLDPAVFSIADAYRRDEYRVAARKPEQDKRYVVLEREGLDRIWLDPARGHALVKREWNWAKGEPLRARITNSDFREVSPGLWLPYRSLIEYACKPGASAGQICLEGELVVDELTLRVPESTFVPQIPVGTVVWDYENNSSWYMPPSDGKSFQKILEESRFYLRPNPARPPVQPSSRTPLIIGIVVVNLVVIAAMLVIFRIRQRRGGNSPGVGI